VAERILKLMTHYPATRSLNPVSLTFTRVCRTTPVGSGRRVSGAISEATKTVRTLIPARRAARVNPLTALRGE
jgi:hypothetical protein